MLHHHKIVHHLILLLLLVQVGMGVLSAQDSPLRATFRSELFELPGGEIGNDIQAIAQDSFGFMWFGSQFGLHRWDGYKLKTYLKDPEDSTSLASDYIESIYVSKDGTVWVGHWGNGLDRFDHETETFRHYNLNLGDPKHNGNNLVASMTEDRNGHLWIGTGNGVLRMDVHTGKLKLFQHDPDNASSLSFNVCRALFVDSEGTLWLGTGFPWGRNPSGGLNRFRPETEDFVRYQHDPNNPNSLTNDKVTALFEDSKGNFWVGTCGDGLHLMDRKSGKFQRLRQDTTNPNQLCGPFVNDAPTRHIRFIYEDDNRKIWIGALEGGIKYYDPESGYIKDHYNQEQDPQSLPVQNPWTMLQSRDGTFWICTKWSRPKVLKFYETSFEYIPLPSPTGTVYSFCETKGQQIWIGTDQAGLLKFDRRTNILTPYRIQPQATNFNATDLDATAFQQENLLNFFLKAIEDKEGRLWIRKYLPFGASRLDPGTGEVTLYQHDQADENSIGEGRGTDLLRDEKDRIWVLTSQGQLNLYDPEGGRFIKYAFARPPGPDFDFEYFALMTPAADGRIWIAGTGISSAQLPPVLTRFDPESASFDTFDISGISDDPVLQYETMQGLIVDELGSLWICSNTKLIKINPNTGESTSWRAAHFGALFFRGMTMGDHGKLWLFGDKICMLDVQSGDKSSFVPTFNMQPTANYTQYVFKASDGLIYFGGQGGFQILDQRKIEIAATAAPPETIIKDFQFLDPAGKSDGKGYQPIHALTTDNISLRHNQNAFKLRFGALAFQHPETNRHEFKLEGYDQQWRPAGADPVATYVKVPPGDYTFRVRGATLRSDWGPEKFIRVQIASPWWATWWAYAFYTLVVVGLLFAFYYFQLNRKLAKAEAHRLQEFDTVKTRLYTNITHEFRTPLTVISGMAGQIRENPKEWFSEGLTMIQRNSSRLLDLVNQMLDLSKLESGKMALHLQQGDIVSFLKYIVESFHSFASNKKIQVHFHAEEDQVMMDFDREKMQQVITNLLSNAVKFTPEGGHIYVRSEVKDATNLKISVRDTGQGISEEEVLYIFDRFYQVDDMATRHGEGTGIGLALVKELIKLMGGEISVKSKPGKGTEFDLLLPVRRSSVLHSAVAESAVVQSARVHSAESGPQATSVGLEQDKRKPQVLLIEDNPDVVAYIVSCLQDEYHINVGKDGQEGVEIAIEDIPDLIVTDVMMPHKDGFEVCRELKSDERTSHIPIIILTAKADMESKLEGLELGADAYLAKPFHKEELQLRIKKLLELRQVLQTHYLNVAGLTEGATIIKEVPQVTGVEDHFVRRAREAVEAHLDDFNFNVEQLGKAMNLSHSQLHRKLTALTGYSAGKFIRYIRLSKAKDLLQDPEMSITAIAFDTGFNDPNYFGRVFKQEIGITPTEWKEKMLE